MGVRRWGGRLSVIRESVCIGSAMLRKKEGADGLGEGG